MATSTIGTGGTFSTIQAWEDAMAATLSAPEVGQLLNQTFSSSSALVTFAGTTTSPTNAITLTTAAGASFRDNANKLTNALRANASNGALVQLTGGYDNAITVSVANVTFQGLQVDCTTGPSRAINAASGPSCTIDSCLLQARPAGSDGVVNLSGTGGICRNSVLVNAGSGGGGIPTQGGSILDCTIVRAAANAAAGTGVARSYGDPLIQGTAIFGFSSATTGAVNASSDYNATDLSSLGTGYPATAHNLTSRAFGSQFQDTGSTLASADWRLKAGSSLIDAGTAISGITTDVVGTTRATPDVGAWEVAAAATSAGPPTLCLLGVGG